MRNACKLFKLFKDFEPIGGSVAKDNEIVDIVRELLEDATPTRLEALFRHSVPVLEFDEMCFSDSEIKINFFIDDTLFGVFGNFSIRFYPTYGRGETTRCVLIASSKLTDLEEILYIDDDRLVIHLLKLITTLTEDLI